MYLFYRKQSLESLIKPMSSLNNSYHSRGSLYHEILSDLFYVAKTQRAACILVYVKNQFYRIYYISGKNI